jgi:hypothetical protein
VRRSGSSSTTKIWVLFCELLELWVATMICV